MCSATSSRAFGVVHRLSLVGIASVGIAYSAAADNLTSAVPRSSAELVLSKSDESQRLRLSEAYGKLPLQFQANHGQTDKRVKFFWRGSATALFLTSSDAVLVPTNPAPT